MNDSQMLMCAFCFLAIACLVIFLMNKSSCCKQACSIERFRTGSQFMNRVPTRALRRRLSRPLHKRKVERFRTGGQKIKPKLKPPKLVGKINHPKVSRKILNHPRFSEFVRIKNKLENQLKRMTPEQLVHYLHVNIGVPLHPNLSKKITENI